MKHRPAADFIPRLGIEEIGLPGLAEAVTEVAAADIELPAFLPRTPREPPPDLDAIFASGREAGLAEARAEAEARVAALRQEAHDALQNALADAGRRWAEEVATPLATQVPEALDALGERLADATGRLLRPFLDSELRDAASRALIDQIRPLLAGEDGVLIRVSGPTALLETLRHVLPARCAAEFVETDATDVTVVAGETTIETRIAAWVARLEGRGPDRRRRAA